MKVLIAPDSFKESMDAQTAAAAIAAGLRRADPSIECVEMPVADGGEGLLAALEGPMGLRRVPLEVRGPLGDPVLASYGWNESGKIAVIEVAEAVGVHLVPAERRDIVAAQSYGVGQLLADALSRGARRVIVGLGGSVTNDGGAGLLRALGVKLLDSEGIELDGSPGSLAAVADLVPGPGDDECGANGPAVAGSGTGGEPDSIRSLTGVEIIVASDVSNPLTGPDGASATFGPQKGASPQDVVTLDRALAHWGTVLENAAGKPVASRPGAGAAGGIGAVLLALGAELRPGIEVVLESLGFADQVASANWVITGEGKIDRQTRQGKAPWGVCRAAAAAGVPTIALCGVRGEGADELVGEGGFAAIIAISDPGTPLATALEQGPENIARVASSAELFLEL